MTGVTEIETVDGDFCFTLRDSGGQDLLLFGFATEAEANIARNAIRQIVQHATVVLPIAQNPPAPGEGAAPAEEADDGDDSDSVRPDETPEATSPFSK